MADNTQQPAENSKDGLALIIGGLFILALVFAAYKYFNNPSSGEVSQDNNSMTQEKTNEEETKGDLNGDGISDKNDESNVQNLGTGGPINQQSTWQATDYKQGEIKSGTYTVKQGDTLWEIAEAVYGNGAEWTKILEANKSSVGYLANGQQALIVTGQTLNLP